MSYVQFIEYCLPVSTVSLTSIFSLSLYLRLHLLYCTCSVISFRRKMHAYIYVPIDIKSVTKANINWFVKFYRHGLLMNWLKRGRWRRQKADKYTKFTLRKHKQHTHTPSNKEKHDQIYVYICKMVIYLSFWNTIATRRPLSLSLSLLALLCNRNVCARVMCLKFSLIPERSTLWQDQTMQNNMSLLFRIWPHTHTAHTHTPRYMYSCAYQQYYLCIIVLMSMQCVLYSVGGYHVIFDWHLTKAHWYWAAYAIRD